MNTPQSFLKKIREVRNMTQLEWSQKFGVRQSTVSDWESGRRLPGIKIVRKFKKVLDEDEFKNLRTILGKFAAASANKKYNL